MAPVPSASWLQGRPVGACRPRRVWWLRILLSRGANLLYVQKCGGWKSAKVLLDTYSHWIEEAAEEASVATPSNQTCKQDMAAGQVGAASRRVELSALTV